MPLNLKALKTFDLDGFLLGPALILSVLGLSVIYNASVSQGDFLNLQKQAVFLVLSLLVFIIFSHLDWRFFRDSRSLTTILYGLCLLSLAGLLFFGVNIRGSRSWYRLGPFSFDPIEFTKVVLIILLAKYFSTRHIELYRMRHILISGFYIFLPCLLILLEPELGSVLVLILLWIGVLIVSGIQLRQFVLLCLAGLLVLVLSWSFLLKPYHKERVATFLFPETAPLDMGWNQIQAKIAIGSGGLVGKGLEASQQVRAGFLPAVQTDFVYAGIVEQFGLVGAALVVLCLAVLAGRLIVVSLSGQSNFPRLFAAGFCIVLVCQSGINLAMNLGWLPVIGIPLPFVSYGGSSLLAMFIGLGIVQSVQKHT